MHGQRVRCYVVSLKAFFVDGADQRFDLNKRRSVINDYIGFFHAFSCLKLLRGLKGLCALGAGHSEIE
jgi:hypothetical protein